MKRSDLIKSREYWISEIQLMLFNLIEDYRKENKLTKTELAEKLGVTKGYITQILNGDFDHKVSKLVDLSLAFNKVPILNFADINQYIANDSNDKVYELISAMRTRNITFETKALVSKETKVSEQSMSNTSESVKVSSKTSSLLHDYCPAA